MPSNDSRASQGKEALDAYIALHPDNYDDKETPLIDMLSDLMHFAYQDGINFEVALALAEGHFDAEKDEE